MGLIGSLQLKIYRKFFMGIFNDNGFFGNIGRSPIIRKNQKSTVIVYITKILKGYEKFNYASHCNRTPLIFHEKRIQQQRKKIKDKAITIFIIFYVIFFTIFNIFTTTNEKKQRKKN